MNGKLWTFMRRHLWNRSRASTAPWLECENRDEQDHLKLNNQPKRYRKWTMAGAIIYKVCCWWKDGGSWPIRHAKDDVERLDIWESGCRDQPWGCTCGALFLRSVCGSKQKPRSPLTQFLTLPNIPPTSKSSKQKNSCGAHVLTSAAAICIDGGKADGKKKKVRRESEKKKRCKMRKKDERKQKNDRNERWRGRGWQKRGR